MAGMSSRARLSSCVYRLLFQHQGRVSAMAGMSSCARSSSCVCLHIHTCVHEKRMPSGWLLLCIIIIIILYYSDAYKNNNVTKIWQNNLN